MQSFLSSVSVPYWCTNNNGDVWFCLKDVCSILEIKNHKDVVSRLNQKGVDISDTLTNGGKQKVTFINESNLYKVIFQSRKQQAERLNQKGVLIIPTLIKRMGHLKRNIFN